MIKRSSSRNQRSKGIKVKHVLQIILLLGVCFWLIYQVKRSHDKKKEFDQTDAKVSVGTQNAYQTPKLNRKFLPGEDKVNQDEKHGEEEEDESIVEDEDKLEHSDEEERNEHESESEQKEGHKPGLRGAGEEQAEDENKSEETEDERGAGDDEIDENDQDKPDVDADRDDEFMEEDKEGGDEKEENENTEDEGKEASLENHNSHEAREENYKGDDASSAVTHDTHTTTAETETANLENSEMSITKSDNKPNYTEDSNRNQPGSDFKITEVKLTDETSSNATSVKETGGGSVSNPVDSSNLNNTSMTSSDNHSEASGNLTVVIPGASINNNMTVTNTSSEQNKVEMFSESNPAQNDTVNITVTEDAKNVQTEGLEQVGNSVSEENRPVSNLTVPVKTENGAASGAESSNVEGGDIDKTTRFVANNETENKGNSEMSEISKTQNNSYVKENTGATKEEEFNFKGTTQMSDSSSANGTSDSVEHHVTDSHILKEVTEVRTDPDRLPDIRNVGDNGDAAATA